LFHEEQLNRINNRRPLPFLHGTPGAQFQQPIASPDTESRLSLSLKKAIAEKQLRKNLPLKCGGDQEELVAM
jgi:hypothetical protein